MLIEDYRMFGVGCAHIRLICPCVEWTIPAGRVGIDCSASPTATYNSDETSDCIRPTQRHSLGDRAYPSCTRLGSEDRRLLKKKEKYHNIIY